MNIYLYHVTFNDFFLNKMNVDPMIVNVFPMVVKLFPKLVDQQTCCPTLSTGKFVQRKSQQSNGGEQIRPVRHCSLPSHLQFESCHSVVVLLDVSHLQKYSNSEPSYCSQINILATCKLAPPSLCPACSVLHTTVWSIIWCKQFNAHALKVL